MVLHPGLSCVVMAVNLPHQADRGSMTAPVNNRSLQMKPAFFRRFLAGLLLALAAQAVPALAGKTPPEITLGDENKTTDRLRVGNLTVELFYKTVVDGESTARTPMARIFEGSRNVLTLTGEESGFAWSPALAQIAEMDPDNTAREVIFASYTGGAHCCNTILIATKTAGKWIIVKAGSYDGEPAGASDADGDGIHEIVQRDNRFLYKFSSYAGSFPPVKIQSLAGNKLIDITRAPRFEPFLRESLKEYEKAVSGFGKGDERNGVLAGYVAAASLVGKGRQAWEIMLKRYDREEDWGLEDCTAGYDSEGNCKGPMAKYASFPMALEAFLRSTGYLPKQ
jgi:hypothetical protein